MAGGKCLMSCDGEDISVLIVADGVRAARPSKMLLREGK